MDERMRFVIRLRLGDSLVTTKHGATGQPWCTACGVGRARGRAARFGA